MSLRLAAQAGNSLTCAFLRAELPDSRRWRRAGLTVVLGIVLASVLSMAMQWVIGKLQAPWPSAVRPDLVALSISVLFFACLVFVLTHRQGRWKLPVSWAFLSASVTLPISIALLGTRYFFGGVSIDQNFRTEYLTRMASSPALADFAYHGLPPYYPSGWFWFGGRFANLIGMPGWAAYKPWSILTLTIVAIIVYELWALLVRRKTAFLLALVTAVIGIQQGAHEPYSWLAAAAVPPLAVLAWSMVRTVVRHGSGKQPGVLSATIALGIAAGCFGDLYTLYMGFFLFVLLTIAVFGLWYARRYGSEEVSPRQAIRALATRVVLFGVVAFLSLLPVWAPYLFGMFGRGTDPNAALHYLPTSGAQIPLPMLEFSPLGAVSLLGLGWIAFRFRKDAIATALGVTIAAVYLWYLLSYAALILGTTLLAFRIYNILTVVLGCAGLFGAIAVARWLGAAFAQHQWRLRVLAALLGFAVLAGIIQGAPGIGTKDKEAFGDYYPDGSTPVGRSEPSDSDYWVPQLNTALREMTGREPQDNILLSSQPILTITSPYWNYQVVTPHYANPMAGYEERNDKIRDWGKTKDSRELAKKLENDPDAPNAFVLKNTSKGPKYPITTDIFPAEPNHTTEGVHFDPKAFDGPAFQKRQVGPYTVVTRR